MFGANVVQPIMQIHLAPPTHQVVRIEYQKRQTQILPPTTMDSESLTPRLSKPPPVGTILPNLLITHSHAIYG